MENSISAQKLSFPSGNRSLVGCIFGPSRNTAGRRGILFVHGQGAAKEGMNCARGWHRATSMRFVSRSISAAMAMTRPTSLEYSVYEHLQDVVAAYDLLAEHEAVDRARIGVCGASYGGYLAALLTAHRAVRRLILRAPSLGTDVDFPPRQQRPPISAGPPKGFDSLEILSRYTGDVLIIESEKDEIIPPSHIAAYVRTCSHAQHEVIPEARHALTDQTWNAMFVDAILRWFIYL